jgi:hypothetical protein
MIEILKIENDFINKYTVATVNIYEITMGVQRLRDTFVLTLDGIMEITDPALLDLVYAKLNAIGYQIVIKTDSPANVTPSDPVVDQAVIDSVTAAADSISASIDTTATTDTDPAAAI